MKIVINKIIPFKGFKCMALWPFIFLRKEKVARFTTTDATHEKIHGRQQLEMLLALFFVWYAVEWLIRLVLYWDSKEAYRNISFEQEAYEFEGDVEYIKKRTLFYWLKYLFKKTYHK